MKAEVESCPVIVRLHGKIRRRDQPQKSNQARLASHKFDTVHGRALLGSKLLFFLLSDQTLADKSTLSLLANGPAHFKNSSSANKMSFQVQM